MTHTHRFQIFEKIAFSFVVMAAAACTTFIAYERSPDVRRALHVGAEILRYSGQYSYASYACSTPAADACGQLPN
jgi:hypothetical protein